MEMEFRHFQMCQRAKQQKFQSEPGNMVRALNFHQLFNCPISVGANANGLPELTR